MPSNAEIFAAWLIHAHSTGPSGPLFPTESQIHGIVEKKPENWFAALAVGEAFCKQVKETEPKTIEDTGTAIMTAAKGVHNISKKFGNILSAPPVGALKR